MLRRQAEPILTVDEVTEKVRIAICSDMSMQNMAVRGELLGFKRHSSGHVYFTVLGKKSRISCVMFRSSAASVLVWPKDGDEVLVKGHLDVYGAYGSYQIYASALMPLGAGAKARAREMLAAKLEAEGVFDPRRKRQLPRYPEVVAVIASTTSAGLQDVIKVASLRYPPAQLLVIPSLMQGSDAPEEIASAFRKCALLNGVSLVMLVRGGGSRDDLDTFDNEAVVRSVSSCPFPVITGLGHQIDSTLSDLAADAAAPTPSAAAERVFPDRRELAALIDGCRRSMSSLMARRASAAADSITDCERRMIFDITRGLIAPSEQKLDAASASMTTSIAHRLSDAETRLSAFAGELQNASPLTILSKGYAVCMTSGGKMIRGVGDTAVKDNIEIQFRDGVAGASVKSVAKRPLKEAVL